jgi:hypothetical protein
MKRITMFLSLLLWPETSRNDHSTTRYMIQRKSDAGAAKAVSRASRPRIAGKMPATLPAPGQWRGLHLLDYRSDEALEGLAKDIIICGWHYGPRDSYPSVPMFLQKGFRVLPAGWKKVDATKALIRYSRDQKHPKMLGHLFTTWSGRKQWSEFPPLVEGLKLKLLKQPE